MNPPVLISVVVIGRNEGERLMRCLASVIAAGWPALDLIYVDSNSSDDSLRRAAQYGARTLSCTQIGAAAARNAGWQIARGDYVLFLDGDTRLHPDFLAHALPVLQQQPELACVWGHRIESDPGQSLYVRVLDLDWRYPAGETLFCGGDALFRHSALSAVDGYRVQLLAGEEPEMCHRLRQQGWRIQHLDCPMTQHDLAIRHFSQYWQRAVRAGFAYAAVSAQTGALWGNEVRHALFTNVILFALVLTCLSGVLLQQPLLLLSSAMVLVALMLRSSWRARWRSNNTVTLLLYGVHSWLEQLPIAWGLLRYGLEQRRQQSASLIDYKRASS